MSEKFSLVDITETVIVAKPVVEWGKCVLCQSDSGETLVNPTKNTRVDGSDGYTTLAGLLSEFHDIGQLKVLPFEVKYDALDDDGAGVVDCMRRNNAVWHKSCYRECSKSRLERARKRSKMEETTLHSPVKTRRITESFQKDQCLFCNCPGTNKLPLHKVMTENTSQRITQYATELQDRKLLARIAGAQDVIALDGAYHDMCYTRFRNRRRSWAASQEGPSNYDNEQRKGFALAGVISYILEVKNSSEDVSPVFKLTDLMKIYEDGMRELGLNCEAHSTRFKERLLSMCPYLEATGAPRQGNLISFREDVDGYIRKSSKRDYDSEGLELFNTAELIRKDLFKHETSNWENMSAECQVRSVPSSLQTLVRMIVRGPQIHDDTRNSDNNDEQVISTIAQLLYFHATKRDRKSFTTSSRRHDRQRETPVPVYIALKLYGETRKKDLVEKAHKLGLSISYDRVKSILQEKANQVCQLFRKEGVVCPPSLRGSIFTTAAADNIDHNTSAATATGSFHGTAISFAQHFPPGQEGTGSRRELCEAQKSARLTQLPAEYSVVQPCSLNVQSAKCPPSHRCTLQLRNETDPRRDEQEWLEGLNSDTCLSWAAHHAAKNRSSPASLTVSALFPVLPETAHSVSTMLHCMRVVTDGIRLLNPHQVPVMTVDQPLYALCKQIQFLCPDTFGEDKFFVMMGGLHIEMALLRVAGQWLEGSGWIEALIQAEVTTPGRAESMIKASHVTRSRYAHEVTAAVLYVLQMDAYNQFLESSDNPSTLEEWKLEKCSHPQFKYWDIVLNLELLILQFVRSIRTANFLLYKESLVRMVPWFFSLDHPHYARWMSVHIRDLAALEDQLPQLAEVFAQGHFVAKKTTRSFSAIALDHAHEQLNAQIKGDGGMVGLTENASALQKWMLSGPELASLVTKFEENILNLVPQEHTFHHRESTSEKTRFAKHVRSLQEAFVDFGNPFLEDTDDLYCISSKKVCSNEVTSCLFRIEELGSTQYQTFVQERLVDRCTGIMGSITKNKCQLMSSSKKSGRPLDRNKAKLSGLKNESSLFSRLYIACQTRQGNIDDFFSHENQPYPPALSDDFGEIRSCTKSDLTKCLVDLSEVSTCSTQPEVQGKFFDGAALVNMLAPKPGLKTFQDYVQHLFIPFIRKELHGGVNRLDVVWDRYLPESLKAGTREKRGEGTRMKVALDTTLPKSWPNFLRVSSNKEALFKILAHAIISAQWDSGVEIFSTIDTGVLSRSQRTDLELLTPCNHEEADTRLLLHVADAVAHGCRRVCVRTVDTDVLVLAVTAVQQITGLEELYVHLGTGKNQQFVSATSVASALGPTRCAALPLFHAFTGCDTVSSFNGRGKKTAFDAWTRDPDATDGFLTLATGNFAGAKAVLEKFVVSMYDRSGKSVTVDECRRLLFTKKHRQLSNLPPTSDALEQHAMRAAYQGGIVWGQTLTSKQTLPCPSSWGWERSPTGDAWIPKWLTQPPASQACLELVKCGCQKGCSEARCRCIKQGMSCTQLCKCDGCSWEQE